MSKRKALEILDDLNITSAEIACLDDRLDDIKHEVGRLVNDVNYLVKRMQEEVEDIEEAE